MESLLCAGTLKKAVANQIRMSPKKLRLPKKLNFSLNRIKTPEKSSITMIGATIKVIVAV